MPEHKNIHEALLAVQLEAPDMPRNATGQIQNRTYQYVSLDDMLGAMRPLLNKHGVVLHQHPTYVLDRPALRTTLTHAASETEVSDMMPLVLAQENPQGVGAALTYYRRYGLQAALGLACETDDDAQSVSAPVPARSAQTTRTPGRQASNGRPPV